MFNRGDKGNGGSQVGSFISGLVIGGLTASAAMLFVAPQSGKKTRKLFLRRTNDLRDQALDLIEDARETAQDTWSRGRETSRHLQHQARDLSRDARSRAAELSNRGQLVVKRQKGRMNGIRSVSKQVMDRVGISG
ncbi:MAG: YtxH domain-containing protein [Chloroflexi bacterium]|nr:YtxH domain-containing protein [Chloroflexota bacterium]